MLARKGFTLVELMVVILIVAILAAVAIPIMRGRIDSAKWTEGKAMIGTIATAIRAYAAGEGQNGNWPNPTVVDLGFVASSGGTGGDLDATYFQENDFTWTADYDSAGIGLTFSIVATADIDTGIKSPTTWTLDNTGLWTADLAGGP